MPDDRLQACPFCMTDVHEMATICNGCGATRRRLGSAWITPRSARRNDMLVAILAWTGIVTVLSFAASALLAMLAT